jgi:hypothetical protein
MTTTKVRPWLFTPNGCAAVSDLLIKQLRAHNLTANSAERWIRERVDLPDGMKLTGAAINAIVTKRYATFRPETLEILCASGIFAPKTREEVWAIACEIEEIARPKDEAGPDKKSRPATLLIEDAMSLLGQAVSELKGASLILSPVDLPQNQAQAIGCLQSILSFNYPGWSAQQIADHFRLEGERLLEATRVELWLQGMALLNPIERTVLGIEGLRPQLPQGGPVTDRWLRLLSEGTWAQPPTTSPPSIDLGTSAGFSGGSLV